MSVWPRGKRGDKGLIRRPATHPSGNGVDANLGAYCALTGDGALAAGGGGVL